MAQTLFVDRSVLDLIDAHVLVERPAPPEHEWAVDDLYFILERFSGQLTFVVDAAVVPEHAATLARLAERYQVAHEPAEPAAAAEAAALVDLGVPSERAPWVALCHHRKLRLFLQADTPVDDYRDRVLRATDVYLVDPMNCLAHLHARLMGRQSL